MSAASTHSGPKGSFIWGNLPEFGRDPIELLERCVREHGDFVPLRFVHRRVLLVNDPAAIEQVLNSRHFRKTIGYRTPFMRRLFGDGLLTSEGEFWTRQRRLAQPAFHRERIANYARTIVRFAEEMLSGWRLGETHDVHLDMMTLTTRVVTMSLFNSDVPREIDDVGRASAAVMQTFTSHTTHGVFC
ncbi:MAG: cytochrome P450 [Verrucomicrobiota bacterium]